VSSSQAIVIVSMKPMTIWPMGAPSACHPNPLPMKIKERENLRRPLQAITSPDATALEFLKKVWKSKRVFSRLRQVRRPQNMHCKRKRRMPALETAIHLSSQGRTPQRRAIRGIVAR
jgi:hypothetical protein